MLSAKWWSFCPSLDLSKETSYWSKGPTAQKVDMFMLFCVNELICEKSCSVYEFSCMYAVLFFSIVVWSHSDIVNFLQDTPNKQGSFVYAPSKWEMTLHCDIISHWLGAYTKWSLQQICIGKSCEVSCGVTISKGNSEHNHLGQALDVAVFDTAKILPHVVCSMSCSQFYLRLSYFSWIIYVLGNSI